MVWVKIQPFQPVTLWKDKWGVGSDNPEKLMLQPKSIFVCNQDTPPALTKYLEMRTVGVGKP